MQLLEPTVDDEAARLETLVSPYVGVVRGVEEVLAAPDDIRCANYLAEVAGAPAGGVYRGRHLGGGSGASHRQARAAAIGEAIERYSACCTAGAEAVVASARELGAEAVAPERFALHHELQHRADGFRYARFTSDTRVAWVQALDLSGGAAWLPAQLVYLAWPNLEGEAPIARATSSGLAAGASVESAVLTALLELLERDAFMITWRWRLELPLLDWSADETLLAFERRFIRPSGARVAAVDLSGFWGVPSAIGVARSAVAGEAPLGVGAAAAPTVERAVAKALDEACRVRSWARNLREPSRGDRFRGPAADEIDDFDQHVAFYADETNARRAAFLDRSSRRRAVSDVAPIPAGGPVEQTAWIVDRLAAAGASAYMVDLTAADVAEAGLRVVRAVVPELCALDVEHRAPLLGGRRLYEVPAQLGLRPGPLHLEDLNLDPHPFP